MPPLPALEFAEGLLFAVPTLAACLGAGILLVRRRLPGLPLLHAVLGVFVASTGLVVAAHVAVGAVGLLSREAVLVAAALVLAAALRVPAVAGRSRGFPAALAEPPWVRAAGVLAVAAAGVAGLAYLLGRSQSPINAVDALATHLPHVERWIEAGHFWQLVQYSPDLSNATYPHNGTVVLLAAVLPWEHTFLVRYVDTVFLVAAATAVWALARQIGAGAGASAVAAAALTAIPVVARPALDQVQVDPPMLAWFAIGALFLLRAARGGGRGELVLAGVGLGLAFGTKWYAVVYVPVLVVAYLVVRRRQGRAVLLRDAGVVAGTIALSGGFWLLRNWVETGNPVHPAEVALGPLTIFDAPPDPLRERGGFTIADYLTDPEVMREHVVPAWWRALGLLGPALLVSLLAAFVAAWRARAWPVLGVAAASLAMAALYPMLPDTAFGEEGYPRLVEPNTRYVVPALLGAAASAAWLAGRGRAARILVLLLLCGAIGEGLVRSYEAITIRQAVAVAAMLALAGVAAYALRRRPVAIAAAAAIAALAIGLWATDRAKSSFPDRDAVIAWLWANHPHDAQIALGKAWNARGLTPVFPAFGPELGNDVDYLGRFVDGTLRAWEDRAAFQRQLRRGDYDVLILGTGLPPRPDGAEPEAGWAGELGYRERVRTARLVLLAR